MAQQIKPGLDNFGVRDRHLYFLFQLSLEPCFPFLGRHVRSEDGDTDAFSRQDALQAAGYVPPPGINRIDVAAAARSEFSLNDLKQVALFGLKTFAVQILGSSDQKLFSSAGFLIEIPAKQLAEVIGPLY